MREVGGKEGGGRALGGSTGAAETTAPEAGAGDDWRDERVLAGACWVGVNTTSWSTVTSSDVGEATSSKPVIVDAEVGTGASVATPPLAGTSIVKDAPDSVLLELGTIAVEPD